MCKNSSTIFSQTHHSWISVKSKVYVSIGHTGQDPRVSQRGSAGHLWRLRHGRQNRTCKKVGKINQCNDPKIQCSLSILLKL